jgi:hypothetical protein
MLTLALCILCQSEYMTHCIRNLHACHYVSLSPMYPEMEFLDNKFNKRVESFALCYALCTLHSPLNCTCGFERKPYSSLV